ncbi:MAG TPA: TfuA-like protein [Myxococcales bacterium]|nr:TfuA-like protein [Myxococcales bacterium]
MSARDLVAFLGPSLGAVAARKLVPCALWPPVGQGDVWRALELKPRAIALIDGVFGAQPPVWQREIVDALAEGVLVFGASSMGALRAAELAPLGMIGVGEIFRRYRDGDLVDDAEVALLYSGAEHGYQPFTVPLVNARHTAEVARRERILTRAQAAALVQRAERMFYQDRTWPRLLGPLDRATRARLERRLSRGDLDLKAKDAAECLRTAAAWLRTRQRPPPLRAPPPPSHARRRRGLPSPTSPPEALLAAWARSLGLGGPDEALAALALRHSERMVPDGPSPSLE